MKNISKHSYSNLNLNEEDLPDLKKMEVGSKHRFTIEAEFTSLRKNESYDMPVMTGGPRPPSQPKFSGSFKVVAVEPVPMPKGKKAARYPEEK